MMTGVILFLAMSAGGTPEVPASKAQAKPIAKAVNLGAEWGVVTSVRRSPAHNRAVGGAPNSFHLQGRAIDIARRAGVRHAQIETAFRRAGYALVESLDEGDHSHFAFAAMAGLKAAARPETAVLAAGVAGPKCAPSGDPSLTARRRPDRFDGCSDMTEPSPRLRPIESAP